MLAQFSSHQLSECGKQPIVLERRDTKEVEAEWPAAKNLVPRVAVKDTFANLGLDNVTIAHHAPDFSEQVLGPYSKLDVNVVCLDNQFNNDFWEI
ncbi:hypothetical protein DSO57_1023646 [Entomophthora muscae]|uniref:Uncharacterized protein n=1 Tax=Entomophthora muscae TaxID=34485 RepID=A0ACC2RHG7_9FUNG|nr:hypothetical protein DSO57_1023646 [Entomophthora muscae]